MVWRVATDDLLPTSEGRAKLAEPVKALIEQELSFGYRTVAWLLGMNKNTVQRLFQLKGWQVRNRPIGQRPRIEGGQGAG